MHKPAFLLSVVALSGLFAGCVGTGPNTEQGAVAGAALGAIAGGVIGNNSRHGDPVTGALVGAAAGGVAGAVIGNSVDQEQGTVYTPSNAPRPTPDDRGYRRPRVSAVAPTAVPTPPPAPQEMQPPQPAPNAVWIAGYWTYDGRAFTWVPGRWEIPPPGARAYVAAHNEMRNGQTVYVPGYWQ